MVCAAGKSSASRSVVDRTEDASGWIESLDKGLLVTLRGKTDCREVNRPPRPRRPAPIVAVETRIRFAKLAKGPLFRRVTDKGTGVGPISMTQGDGPAWSSRGRLLPLLAAMLPRTNAGRNSRAIRYAPALPPRPRSMSATSRSGLATPARKCPTNNNAGATASGNLTKHRVSKRLLPCPA